MKSKSKTRRLYIERKTQDGRFLNDKGPAVIADAALSQTGRTLYYKGLELKRPASNEQSCVYGNYYDAVSGDEFWVSGVKKEGSNRHPWAEKSPVVEDGEL